MFKKIGEDLPVLNYLDDEGVIVCSSCQEPMVTIEIDENGNIETVCKCKHPEAVQFDA